MCSMAKLFVILDKFFFVCVRVCACARERVCNMAKHFVIYVFFSDNLDIFRSRLKKKKHGGSNIHNFRHVARMSIITDNEENITFNV